MNRRVLAFTLWLLYSASSMWFGLLPHQHKHACLDFDSDCAVCVWRINTTTDAPAEPPKPIFHHVVVVSVLPPVSVAVDTEFVPSTASRAPPQTLV